MINLRLILSLLLYLVSQPALAAIDVRISGVDEAQLENIKAYLTIEEKRDEPELTRRWVTHMHELAPEEIREALQPFGYYAPEITSRLRQHGSDWVASYHIVPGELTRVSVVDIRIDGPGRDESEVRQAVTAFPLAAGDILNTEHYDTGKEDLLTLLSRLGYARARATTHRIVVDAETGKARIELVIETGPKYYIGRLDIHQDLLAPEFLDRFIHVHSGDVYSQEKLLALQNDLVVSQYFSVVDVNPLFAQAEQHEVPVDVALTPANRHNIDFGLGYFTDIGVTGSARWIYRPINRRGHYTDTLLRLSQKKSTFRASYLVPVRNPVTDRLAFTFKLETEDTDTVERDTADLQAGYFFDWKDWSARVFTDLKHEKFTTGSQPETTTTMLSIGGNIERTWLDDESEFPRSGKHWFLELKGSPGIISDTAYVRSHVKTKYLFPLGQGGRLMMRGELGLAAVQYFPKYPSSLRFYAGGDQSVRGYAYQSLGPLDKYGEVAGGRNIVTGSIEYDHLLVGKWVGAVFADAGNAFNSSLDTLFYSTGVGVRWLSPIGPVRLDLAFPLNGQSVDADTWRIHLGFGADL